MRTRTTVPREADEMKKDILALFALVLVIAVIAGGTNVQSVK